MAKGSKFVVGYRRKRKGKTNYKKRLELLKSGLHRLVVRPSNKHITIQILEYRDDGDLVKASAHSEELKEFGWTQPTGNTPSAYLTGLLCGLRSKNTGVKKAIMDIGLRPSIKGSRIYAGLKGVIDSGLTIPFDENMLPDKERIQGVHISEYKKDKKILSAFDKTKNNIINSFKKFTK